MFDSEHDTLKSGEQHIIFQEYNNVVEELKQDLEICKTEQNSIRLELQALYVENKDSSDAMRNHISLIHLEECGDESIQNNIVTNLKERIAVLQMEKDSAVQLWQISMNAIDALEQELKSHITDDKEAKFYEEQLKDVKQSYSEAIRALESKLLQVKENFTKQQSLWMTSKETTETLKHEKQEMARRLQEFQRDAQEKDRNSQQRIQSLMEELSAIKVETQRLNHLQSDLEKKLSESRRITGNVMAKNEETKCKMAEALDLIESAIKEKDFVLQREAQVVEQKVRLEARLISITEEHAVKMQEEIAKLKDTHEHNVKKYILEIKELKSELREKVTLLDRSQRESRLAEEELDRMRRNSEDNLLEKSAAKFLNLERDLKHAGTKLEARNEMYEKQYNSEMQQLREKIANLEENLVISNERLKQIQQQNSINVKDCIKLDEGTKDTNDRYIDLENQLVKATDDKELLINELKLLQSAFDREIHKRDYERHTLENRIRELEANPQKTYYETENKSRINISPTQAFSHQSDAINKHTLDIRVENMNHNWQSLLSEQLNKQQEQFDKKMKEMTQHVTVHQKLSRRWKEEAKSLTTRFQIKSKELRGRINSLQKENVELHKALTICRQQFTQYRTDTIQSYIQGSETR